MNVTTATPRERAQRLLDRCAVPPAALGVDDPIRVIHDLIHEDEWEADNARGEVSDLEEQIDELERVARDVEEVQDELSEFADAVRDAIGEGAAEAKRDELPGLIRALRGVSA